jgi:hypothetical protein
MSTTTCTVCGKPYWRFCHHCEQPFCFDHLSARFLTPHCSACYDKYHFGEATAQQRAASPSPRALAPAVGDIYILPDGRHLLVVEVWHSPAPPTLGRATCLLGAWEPTAAMFAPVVPHQSALFGFVGSGSLPFERVGGIGTEAAQRIYRDGQTLLAVASGASGGAT